MRSQHLASCPWPRSTPCRGRRFETYIAELCRRDGCTKVVVSGKSGDLGADIVGYLADGRKLVVQCAKDALGLALRQDIVALHRDLLGSWVKGAHLETLMPLNGSGDGTRRRSLAWHRPASATLEDQEGDRCRMR
jgi:restriction system protein